MKKSGTRILSLVLAIVLIFSVNSLGFSFADGNTVVINEIESDPPSGENDWVELYNNSTQNIDISGWILSDDKGLERLKKGKTTPFPEGTFIPAGGFLVFDVDAPPYDFGLGDSDTVNLYDKNKNLVDSITYTKHATDTLGRYPDGTGDFVETISTKGTANKIEENTGDPGNPPQTHVESTLRINEIETNHDVFKDYVEIINIGEQPVDISGWYIMDDDPVGHAQDMIPVAQGTVIAPGQLYVFDTDTHFTFGLGKNDTVTLRNPQGLIADEYTWSDGHPNGTWSRVPDGTGNFIDHPNSKGVLNQATNLSVVINEIESNGSDRDWVEIYNNSENAVNITGWYIKDDSLDHFSVRLPEGTILPAKGYFVFEADLEGDIKHFNFGLGGADKVELYDANDTLIDEHAWTSHAKFGLSRIPNGTGDFKDVPLTKGSENIDADTQEEEFQYPVTLAWPGPSGLQFLDTIQMFKEDSSGLDYHDGALWLVDNGTGTIWKMTLDNRGIPSFAPGFENGKKVRFKKDADKPNAAGPDAEGISLDNKGMVYLAVERDNSAKGVNFNVVLQADPNQETQELVALREWNVTEYIDNARQARGVQNYQVKSNMGIEAIEWVPNSALDGKLFDANTNAPYKSTDYSSMNDGLFFVGVEDDGYIYIFALGEDESITLISQINAGMGMVMGLDYDELMDEIWAHADNGRMNIPARINLNATNNPNIRYYNPPEELDALKNNEGFAIASINVGGLRPVYWAEDGITTNSLKMGFINTYSFPKENKKNTGNAASAPDTVPVEEGKVGVGYTESNGSVSLDIPEEKAEEIVGKSTGGEVSVDVSGVKNATSAELPKEALAAFDKAGLGVEVKLPGGNISLDNEATASVLGQVQGKNVSVELVPVKTEELNDAQKKSVKAGDIVVDINIHSGGQKISSFNGKLTVRLPYTGPQPVAVWYLNDKGELERVVCSFKNGEVIFSLNHLSLYMLGPDTERTEKWVNPFIDVKDSDWFSDEVAFIVKKGIMKGTGDKNFSPNASATRSMFVAMLHRLEGSPEYATSTPFADVDDGSWYDMAIRWALQSGVTSGVSEHRFGTDDSITREQLVTMLCRYASGKGLSVATDKTLAGYTDQNEISPWAADAMRWAVDKGIIEGVASNVLDPKGTATRAQIAAIFQRFIENVLAM